MKSLDLALRLRMQRPARRVGQNDSIMKWEYRTMFLAASKLSGRQNLEAWELALNALGQEGWELVAVSGRIAYLKRLIS